MGDWWGHEGPGAEVLDRSEHSLTHSRQNAGLQPNVKFGNEIAPIS